MNVYVFLVHESKVPVLMADFNCFYNIFLFKGSGKKTLARKLAQIWKCILIEGKHALCLERCIKFIIPFVLGGTCNMTTNLHPQSCKVIHVILLVKWREMIEIQGAQRFSETDHEKIEGSSLSVFVLCLIQGGGGRGEEGRGSEGARRRDVLQETEA